uniref:Somatostatin receptor type 5-like n=1 Tax=Paramormyrops kingsleyae TaxID=1676925 RepID=A0A3B3RNK2_9TELE|nr:somatostatin receptor type 5-like isoform X1 [Paramormyrops kingsleyae]
MTNRSIAKMTSVEPPSITGGFNHSAGSMGNNSLGNYTSFQGESNIVVSMISLTVFVVGLLGNMLAIYVVLRYAKMKTVTNLYILNLSVADELYILGLPFLTTQNVLSYWPFGSFLCRVVMTTDSINQFTGIFSLTVMSIDRYLAVVHPIRSANWRRPQIAKVINGLVWLLSIFVVLPVIIYADVQEDFNTCNISWPEPHNLWSTAFILYTAILGFLGPLLVISFCYLLIIIKVRSVGARAGLTSRRRSERKVTRMVVIMVLVFLLCWMPFYVTNMVNLVIILPGNSFTAGLYFFTVILTYVNSCANPVLYGFLSDNFKQSFLKVLCVHKIAGVQHNNPGRPHLQRANANNSLVLLNSNGFNGHHQNSQGIQMETCFNAKTEPLSLQAAEKHTL